MPSVNFVEEVDKVFERYAVAASLGSDLYHCYREGTCYILIKCYFEAHRELRFRPVIQKLPSNRGC